MVLRKKKEMNIIQHFLKKAVLYPDKAAIIDPKHRISFKQLKSEIEETAAYFYKKGIRAGDRVLIFVPMSVELYRTVLAIFYMGATAVFLDEWVSKKRLEVCCDIADCKAFIAVSKVRILAIFSKAIRKIPIHLGTSYKGSDQKIAMYPANGEETALITFTTGSTGIPKAAKRTHAFLNEQFDALKKAVEPQVKDVDMPVLPIVLLLNLGIGCTSVIADFKASKPNKIVPKKIINQINKYQVNRLTASPFFIKVLARYLIETKQNTPTLKKVFTGGAPVFPNEASLYNEAFGDTHIRVVYGSTEAEPISSIDTKTLTNAQNKNITKGLNVGVPYGDLIEVKIIKIIEDVIELNHENDLDEMPKGNIGEIIVAGKHVLRAYFNNEAALKRNKIFIGDKVWHRTGDAGYFGDNGTLYLTGRCSSMIPTENTWIAPFLYENALQNIEGVEMGTVLKFKDKILVIIEAEAGATKEKIQEQIEGSNLHFNEIKFIPKIPRDPRHNSKVAYKVLQQQLVNS